ncbi:125 kDa kinesin-related protein [Spatholobus suberectus]|nr:125 kDa kinesin-related protein [Spatholobus suberectus]
MVCDYRDCLKAYHPHCVDKEDSFLENGSKWTCNSHFCSLCHKASKFRCFCCPKAVCGNCIYDAEFATVKGLKGFCSHCSKLAHLIEENADVDSDGEKVDFKDRDTYEFLFSEYYEIIKEEEGLNSQHAYSAHRFFKNGKNKCDLDQDEIGEGQDDTGDSEDVSNFIATDCDELNDTAGSKSVRKKKGMKKLNSMKGKVKDKKKEFIGWASRSLIEFLQYISKDTSKEFSEHDVTSIIIEYCRENKLFDPVKKRKIHCDAQLRSLLGRKSVNRNSIQNLLVPHFAENLEEMDAISSSSEYVDYNEPFNFSRKRKLISSTKSHHPNLVSEEHQSCFAAIVSSNLKLVYLKRSLVDELSKQPETFDSKVLGSYVRVKSDPHDYLQKNSHLLVQVVGINRSLKNDEINKEIMLQLSNVPKNVPICKISDDDFSEEECQDLYHRMRNGLLKQPTILELQQKARSLHEDIIKHWIPRELVLLQNRIDQANEKGWRREYPFMICILDCCFRLVAKGQSVMNCYPI